MRRANPRLLLPIICFCLFAPDVHGETNLPFSTKSQWPGYGRGSVQSLAISGNYAYVAVSDGGMTVLDITDPLHPTAVAGFEIPLHGSAYDLKVVGGYAFVSAVRGVEIIGVHNPAKPAHVAFFASSSELGSLDVVGNRAYVTRLSSGDFGIIDLSNLAAPSVLGGPPMPSVGVAQAIQVIGSHAFVADTSAGLRIVDISEPFDNLAPIGTYTSLYDVSGVYVVEDTAYVVSFDLNFPTSGTLDIVDVANRANPQRVGRANLARGAFGVRVKDKRAFVVGFNDFEIFDVSETANPVHVGGVALPGEASATAVEVSGNYAFVAAGTGGLLVYDISGGGDPVLIATAPLNSVTAAVDVVGNYAYLADRLAGVRILDVADASNPKLLSTITSEGTINLRLAGNYAYFANAKFGLETVNVKDPANPIVTSVLKNNGDVWDVRVSGANLFAAGGTRGLQIFSLAEPANPVWQTNVATTGAASALAVDGTRAYLATQKGLVIFDVSNAAAPAILSVYNPLIEYTAVDVVGSRAYGVVNAGIDIADVTDAANPQTMGFVQLNGPTRVKVVGNFAYISTLTGGGFGGGFVVDVSDPAFPRTRGRFHRNRTVADLQVVGDRIYAAEQSWGFAILKQEMPPLTFLDEGNLLPDGSYQVRWDGEIEFPQLQTSADFQTWMTEPTYQSWGIISTFVFSPTNSAPRIFRLVLPPSP